MTDREPDPDASGAWARIRQSYDAVASRYEGEFAHELARKPYDRELLDRFAAAAADPVVEVGSGPGQIGGYLRDRGRQVIATDFSLAMARLASPRVAGTAVADLRELPIRDGSAGSVIGFYCLIHLRREELSVALREFRRVLRPDGRLLISAHEGDGEISAEEFLGERVPFVATLFSLDELVEATRSAGMEVRLASRRTPYESEGATVRLYLEAVQP